ncbi:MAG TPA: hypothetical protein VNI84_11155 [Pyrinomonadaceae bacterium]|nr:hypothetical protein [Pyrinomonadaceae bacterium]
MKQQRNKHYKPAWQRTRIGSFIFNLKRNRLWLHRLASVWLFLIVFEVACPILDCQTAVDLEPAERANISIYNGYNAWDASQPEAALTQSAGDEKSSGTMTGSAAAHCTDECLCHVTAIPSLAFNFPGNYIQPSIAAVGYNDAPTLSLPPPFQPPKIS